MKVFSCQLFTIIILVSLGFSSISAQSKTKYQVVINHEEQYSIWLLDEKLPKGWNVTKVQGSQSKCQGYIEEVWTDMRPLSIRTMRLPKNTRYQVVINHEEQYSIWPLEKRVPKNWKAVKMKGSLEDCTKYIKEVWTDMRPLSLRKKVKYNKSGR